MLRQKPTIMRQQKSLKNTWWAIYFITFIKSN